MIYKLLEPTVEGLLNLIPNTTFQSNSCSPFAAKTPTRNPNLPQCKREEVGPLSRSGQAMTK